MLQLNLIVFKWDVFASDNVCAFNSSLLGIDSGLLFGMIAEGLMGCGFTEYAATPK